MIIMEKNLSSLIKSSSRYVLGLTLALIPNCAPPTSEDDNNENDAPIVKKISSGVYTGAVNCQAITDAPSINFHESLYINENNFQFEFSESGRPILGGIEIKAGLEITEETLFNQSGAEVKKFTETGDQYSTTVEFELEAESNGSFNDVVNGEGYWTDNGRISASENFKFTQTDESSIQISLRGNALYEFDPPINNWSRSVDCQGTLYKE